MAATHRSNTTIFLTIIPVSEPSAAKHVRRSKKNNITKNEIGIFCENVQSIIQNNNLNANIFALRLNVKFNLIASNNWWGNSDATEIANVIIDAADRELITKQVGTVYYEPFIDERIVDAGFPYPTLLDSK